MLGINESIYLKLDAGKVILNEGDVCQLIPLVGQGDIRVYKVGDSGREITLYHINPGESCILSSSSILGGTNFPANAIVETNTEIVGINKSFFKNYIIIWFKERDEFGYLFVYIFYKKGV